MNDMSGSFANASLIRDFSSGRLASAPVAVATPRLAPPRAFSEAAALMEEALGQLRAAETALERQLGDLRAYMNAPAAAA